MQYERWKIVGEGGVEVVQCSLEESRISVRTAPTSSTMTLPVGGIEPPITMPKEHAEALAMILRQSNVPGFQGKARAIRA